MKHILLTLIFIFPFISHAQTVQAVVYDYDNIGNRVLRHVQVVALKPGKEPLQHIDTTFVETNEQLKDHENSMLSKEILKIYPNPFTETVIVENSTWQVSTDATLVIVDATGKLIKSQKVTSCKENIDLKSVSAGTYHVRYIVSQEVKSYWQIVKL